MGFGILFIGYFIAFVGGLTPISMYTYVLGAGIIVYSLKNLIYENKLFLASAFTAGALELVSIAVVILKLCGLDKHAFYSVLSIIQSYLAPALSIALLLAIYVIAKSVELKKLQSKAILNLIIESIYVIFAIILKLVKGDMTKNVIFKISFISQVFAVLFALVVIFSCYMRICYEDDKDMQREETGFKPLDALNKGLNKVTKKKDKTEKKK